MSVEWRRLGPILTLTLMTYNRNDDIMKCLT